MAGEFEFTFEDAFTFADKMAKAPQVVQKEMVTAVDRLAIAGVGHAIDVVPVLTGHLRRSIAKEATTWSGDGATGRYGTATPYGPFVEYGTWKMAAQPYMEPSLMLVQRQSGREFGAMLKRIMAQIGVG